MKTPRLVAMAAIASMLHMTPAAAQQVFTMKLSTPTINDTTHEWMKIFKEGAEARAKGRLKVEIYPANQLGALPRTIEGVALGTIELTYGASGYFASYDPRFEAMETPGLFDTLNIANRAMADAQVRQRLATYGSAKGVEPLVCAANGPNAVASLKPIRKPEDFSGLKVRTTGTTALQVNPMRALGASPVAMSIGEGLPALQNKTIDAVAAGPVIFTGFKYYDVVKQYTVLPKTYLMACAVVNRAFMKSLGPELEQVVREEALRAQLAVIPKFDAEFATNRQAWEKNGGEVIDFAPADAARYLDVVRDATSKVSNSATLKPEVDLMRAAAERVKTS